MCNGVHEYRNTSRARINMLYNLRKKDIDGTLNKGEIENGVTDEDFGDRYCFADLNEMNFNPDGKYDNKHIPKQYNAKKQRSN
jgi:hypothetical protein